MSKTCLHGPCNNKVMRSGIYCYETYGDCARQDAVRLGKPAQTFRSSRERGLWGVGNVRSSIRSAGKAVVRTFRGKANVDAASADLFRLKYGGKGGGYAQFVKDTKAARSYPDDFAHMRDVADTVSTLAAYYKVRIPKSVHGVESRAAYLQGVANATDPAMAEHVRDSISASLTREFDKSERNLAPEELLQNLKARYGER